MNGEKRAIRQILRERRRRLAAAVVDAAGAAVCTRLRTFHTFVTAASVIAYIADENEIPITPLFDDIARTNRPLYLPRTSPVEGLIRWYPGERLCVGCGGVLEPANGAVAHPQTPALALIPVVGWDLAGTRLGRGGGFYDRLLAGLPEGVVRVGVAYEDAQRLELPREPWDVSLHYVITEQRIVRCANATPRLQLLQEGG